MSLITIQHPYLRAVLPLVMVLFVLFYLPSGTCAQSYKQYVKAGDKAFAEQSWMQSLNYYAKALAFKPRKKTLLLQYALSAKELSAYDIAIPIFIELSKEKDAFFSVAAFHLGACYRLKGEYEKAISAYEQYIMQDKVDAQLKLDAITFIEDCKWAFNVVQSRTRDSVIHLNQKINGPWSEFAPWYHKDTLYFSSLRFDNKKDPITPSRKLSGVLYSIKGAKARTVPRQFNDPDRHTAHTITSLNGNFQVYTLCDYQQIGTAIICQLYLRTWDLKKKRWSKPTLLPESINFKGATSTQPTLQLLSSGKYRLIFVSNRPGGTGKNDLWYSDQQPDGSWGIPVPLSSINTKGNEGTPYFHNRSQVLYFSSDGRRGLGGYDIYKSEWDGNSFGEVSHLGYPINTSYNDLYYFINADSTHVYLSSNRPGSYYLDEINKACCNDIWAVLLEKPNIPNQPQKNTIDSSLIALIPNKESGIPNPLKIDAEPEPTTLEAFLPLRLYFHNDEPDKRTQKTTTKQTYGQSFANYYQLKTEYLQEYGKGLPDEARKLAGIQIEDFFEKEVRKGNDWLQRFSEILLDRLEQGDQVEIFVKGFTSPRAKSDYNLNLGKRRISAVRNHFSDWEDGIFQNFLATGQLKISERSFGETTASADVSDVLEDQRNSVYSPAAARERRVEIVEIKSNSRQ